MLHVQHLPLLCLPTPSTVPDTAIAPTDAARYHPLSGSARYPWTELAWFTGKLECRPVRRDKAATYEVKHPPLK
jgi:hypothetical protein